MIALLCSVAIVAVADEAGGAPLFVINGATVLDKKTNLTWYRCSAGQQWKTGTGCTGEVKTMTYAEALRFDEAQRKTGNGWRVPTASELKTLIDYNRIASRQNPAIDVAAFPNMQDAHTPLWYWSSDPEDDANAWFVSFDDSTENYGVSFGDRGGLGAVRLVSGGP